MQGRAGGHVWVNTRDANEGETGGQTLDGPVSKSVAACALSLWKRAHNLRHRQNIAVSKEAKSCACRPVGGRFDGKNVLSGIYGFSRVGHSELCGLDGFVGKCYAGMVTNETFGREGCAIL